MYFSFLKCYPCSQLFQGFNLTVTQPQSKQAQYSLPKKSYFVLQRTRLVLAAKGIEYECININLREKPEWFLELNPLGKVPTIEHPDGKVIYESAICCGMYLGSSGESAHLPPMCPGFDSWTRHHISGLSLLVLYSAPRGFSPGTPFSPSPQKPTFDLSWFRGNLVYSLSNK